jgi:transcriptional regulator with GAF, ATPase, and Fis domain
MEEERIGLSAKERERLKVLHEITQGHLRQIDAARRLRLSDRQVRRLLQRLGHAVRMARVSTRAWNMSEPGQC